MSSAELNPLIVVVLVGGVGVVLPALLWLMRRVDLGRRVRLSSLAAGLALGGYWLLYSRLGWTGPLVRLLFVAQFLLIVNLGLQVLELVVWETTLKRRLGMELPRILIDLLGFVMLAVAAVVAVAQAAGTHVELSHVLVTSTVLSAVLGLALQEALGNVFAGLALHLEGPFEVGDWVNIATHEGQVEEMGWRTTTIRTRDDHHVTVPNGEVARKEFVNYYRPTRLQALNNVIGGSYRDPPARVSEVLAGAATDAAGVAAAPEPQVFVEGYDDFAVRYRVKYWIHDYQDAPRIRSAVNTNIYYRLKRAGMTIPFPIRDVNLRRAPDPASLAADSLQGTQSRLRAVPLLAPLDDGHIAQVARDSRTQSYAPGETIVRAGDAGDSLYVVHVGEVAVEMAAEGGAIEVARRGPGEHFGEMSLLLGEPRSATVRALTETEVVCVDRAAFRGVLLAQPGIAEALSAALEERRAGTARALEQVRPAAGDTPRQELLGRIRSFFGLDIP
jgi:small-conductance mechanosensitive channel/CRP-like cAMP-binding protein